MGELAINDNTFLSEEIKYEDNVKILNLHQ